MKQLLIEARKVIEDPAHWTTEFVARNKDGASVVSTSLEAVCWCAMGALLKCRKEAFSDYDRATDLLNTVAWTMSGMYFTELNDSMGHEAVLKMFDMAIESVP